MVVFSNKLSFVAFSKLTHHRYIWNSLFDIYFLEINFSFLKNEKLISDFMLLHNSLFKLEKNFWVLKFEIFDISHTQKLKKLFLSFNTNQILIYLPENTFLQETLSEFENIAHLHLWEIPLNFEIPKSIFEYNEKYLKFQKDIIKLQYILYSLKISYQNISTITNNANNSYIQLSQNRSKLTAQNLEKNIHYYEKLYTSFLAKIKE